LVSIFIRIIIKSFSGVQGAVFQKSPLAAEGKVKNICKGDWRRLTNRMIPFVDYILERIPEKVFS
jgi:hypothetical protein